MHAFAFANRRRGRVITARGCTAHGEITAFTRRRSNRPDRFRPAASMAEHTLLSSADSASDRLRSVCFHSSACYNFQSKPLPSDTYMPRSLTSASRTRLACIHMLCYDKASVNSLGLASVTDATRIHFQCGVHACRVAVACVRGQYHLDPYSENTHTHTHSHRY